MVPPFIRHSAKRTSSVAGRGIVALALLAAIASAGAPGATAADVAPPAAEAAREPGAAADGLVLAVLDAVVRFDRYETSLADGADAAVDRLASRLSTLERVLSIRVAGHADSRGPEDANMVLSRLRAEAVAAAFRARYPDARIVSLAFGETEPVSENVTDEGRAMNRRVEVQVIGVELEPDGTEGPAGNPPDRY